MAEFWTIPLKAVELGKFIGLLHGGGDYALYISHLCTSKKKVWYNNLFGVVIYFMLGAFYMEDNIQKNMEFPPSFGNGTIQHAAISVHLFTLHNVYKRASVWLLLLNLRNDLLWARKYKCLSPISICLFSG